MTAPHLTQPHAGTFQRDFLASIVVFLVALPLCMGIAVASGLPVSAGLISGIIGGIVVGALAGCPLQVSGPAAGLTVLVFAIVQRDGPEHLGLAIVWAGGLQLLAGVGRLGQWFRAVSPAVIRGMLAGIGFLILASQFHVMFDGLPPGHGAENLARVGATLLKAWEPQAPSHPQAPQDQGRLLQTARSCLTEQAAIHRRYFSQPAPGTHGEPAEPKPVDWAAARQAQGALLQRLTTAQEMIERGEPGHHSREAYRVARQAVETVAERLSMPDARRAGADAEFAVQALREWSLSLQQPWTAGLCGFATIFLMILWQELAPPRWRVLPAALLAIVAVTLASVWLQVPVLRVELPESLWSGVAIDHWSGTGTAAWGAAFADGMLIAVVASAETLLCAAAVDQIHPGPSTNYDRELVAQGVGNTLCGLLGGLPITGVIVRSTANVQAGGRTRWSAILHGVWLFLFVTWMAGILRLMPTSSLAAILVYTGYKLIDVRSFRELLGYGWSEAAIYVVTVATMVFEDLLIGVLTGFGLSALKLLYLHSQLTITLEPLEGDRTVRMRLRGAATFLRLPLLAARLEGLPPGVQLHVDLSELQSIDHACLELFSTWARRQAAQGGTLTIDWDWLYARYRRENHSLPTTPPV